MHRLIFEKTGNAIWISHLDLMRLFQRAFKRAGLQLTHTQGFNPRPSVSIALPLSVGVESHCELLDFELYGDPVSCNEICQRLNMALTDGIRVLSVYEQGRKLKELSLLKCRIRLEYDHGVPVGADKHILELFQNDEVIVAKKTKSGLQDQNIVTMIRNLTCQSISEHMLEVHAIICCQNPTLNPAQIVTAIETYLPGEKPNFSKCCRIEIFDANETVFR